MRPERDRPQETVQNVKKYYTVGLIFCGLALVAHISKKMGADGLATALALLVILGMSTLATIYLIKRAKHAAAQNSGRTGAYSPGATAIWKTLWILPVALFFLGFIADLFLGWKEEGQIAGVIAVLLLIPIIPNYIVLGIMRLVQRNNGKAPN